MKVYEEPGKHFNRSMNEAADRYTAGLQRAGLNPSETLTKAVADRAVRKAQEEYKRNMQVTLNHNIGYILAQHAEREKQIRREGAKMALWTCPLAAAMFALLGWMALSSGYVAGVVLLWIGSLVFLAMMVVALWLAKR